MTIDIGNSKLSAGVVEGSAVVHEVGTVEPVSDVPVEAQVTNAFKRILDTIEDLRAEGVVVSSVVPRALEIFEHLWIGKRKHEGMRSIIVDHECALPYVLDVDQPETVGADRLCNVAAAVAMGFQDAIVVDLGTANTFDLLRDGWFVGGLIGPGAERSHRALVESGAQLPSIPFAHPRALFGRTTKSAMQAGSFHQAVGAVEHVIKRLRVDRPDRPCLLAGGLAEAIGPELGFEVLYVPNMTLIGAARIAAENES